MSKTIKVNGLSVTDILAMDANNLNEDDLRAVTTRLVSAGNKRLRSFERVNERSPAYRYIEKSGGAFSVKNKSFGELREEFSRIKGFFESETGTRRGWNRVKRETVKSLKKMGVNISVNNFNEIWETYEKLKEISPGVESKRFKYNAISDINNLIEENPIGVIPDDLTDEEIEDMQKRRIINLAMKIAGESVQSYEEMIENEDEESEGVSGFFEI